jgi:L-fuconolactonase
VIDSHVHFWDPAELHYPWLEDLPALNRAFLPEDYARAVGDAPIERIVFVEANPRPDQSTCEVELVERLALAEPRGCTIAGIVASVDLTDEGARDAALDRLAGSRLVRGVRQNIQGHAPGFCLQPAFVDGVRAVARRGLVFDLCATHDQLGEVVELVGRVPEGRFVLDHCGKPPVRDRLLEPWATHVARLAGHEGVSCKLSGLLTEGDAATRGDDALRPYAEHVVAHFGTHRVLYGSDWPVLTLAGGYGDWYDFTARLTAGWGDAERRRFYGENAARVYGL